MADKNNAKCSICGNEYYVCLSCHDSMKLHPWKIHCCSASHFQVFQVLRGFSTNVYTKDEAKEKLQNINLEDLNSFRPHIKKVIKDILKEDKPVVKTIEKVESTKVITEIEVAKPKEKMAVGDVKNIIKPTVSRKKNYRMETK